MRLLLKDLFRVEASAKESIKIGRVEKGWTSRQLHPEEGASRNRFSSPRKWDGTSDNPPAVVISLTDKTIQIKAPAAVLLQIGI